MLGGKVGGSKGNSKYERLFLNGKLELGGKSETGW